MSVFAIGDLHLSGASPKPMDIFGDHWTEHWSRVKENWLSIVTEEDLVLIPGDLSWAMKLEDAAYDLDDICSLPGTKLIMKGNHDYWWSSLSKVNSLLSNNTFALQNNSFRFKESVIAGTRGWTCPGTNQYNPAEDEKLYIREAGRLELSLKIAREASPGGLLIGMMHYPPSDKYGTSNLYTDLFEKYGAAEVVYGHLHSASIPGALSGNIRGINYTLVSCDAIGFSPLKII
jgi:uncharacterized protein